MNRLTLTVFIFSLTISAIIAQTDADRAYIISKTNVEKLKELSEKYQAAYDAAMSDSLIPKKIVYRDGEIGHLTGMDQNGKPIYSLDDNENAAISSKVDRIQVGGSSGFDLDGEGVEIGVWEGSLPLPTHQDLAGKVTHAEFDAIGGHATHTATTMVGAGVNPPAKGMAPGATILSHDSSGDEPEIVGFALNGGILSNHSYSSGNPDGNIPEYGVYTPYAAEWDGILFNAPYLTIVKSASNSRNDGVNLGDGGYDIIFGSGGSKNTITVGAVDDVLEYTGPSSVTQSEFSNWGPTDDWRIKPDITANGVSVLSGDKDHDTDYSFRNGTSMSTPVVTGTAALLQQFYHDLNGVYIKAATMKALLLCTTDELGAHDGPDFESGWGLLNAERAAEVVANDGSTSSINELSIADGETYTMEIEVDGSSSLELVIAWTDPEGIPLNGGGLDNPASMLVNDLDVRISGDNDLFQPWVLTPDSTFSNFTDAPTKGDNFRDNVERIDISNLAAGFYTVTVTHKNSLANGVQDFSMVINGLKEVPVSIADELTKKESILVYPVPTHDGKLNIRIPEHYYSGHYTLQVSDNNGRLLSSTIYAEKELSLNVSHLSPGVYYIGIQTGKKRYNEQIVIQK